MPATDAPCTMLALLRDLGGELRAFRTQAARHRPAPPADGLVLDVGAGHAPDPRADLVVDKYVADDFERATRLSIDKPIVVADGHALPFEDGACAYVISAHVLEHATDPTAFAGELARVGHQGFVQVPTREAELTFGWPFHPWLIDLEDGTLVFHPRGDATAPAREVFHHAVVDSPVFRLWFGAHRDVWHHTLHWRGAIPTRVAGASQAPQTASLDIERTLDALPKMRAHGPTGALRDALRCPADHGRLTTQAERLACATCGRAYPVAGGVPVLLAEAAG